MLYKELTEKYGSPVYQRIDAAATKEQKAKLGKLSPSQVKAKELAGEPISAILTEAPGNHAPIGGLKVTTENGWFAARPSGTEDVYKIYAESFKGQDHLKQIELGCPLAALGSETARQTPEVRRVTTRHVKETIDLVARQFPDWGQPGAHERALVTVATMVGTLLLARAVDEPALSDALCQAALKHLAPT